MYLRTHKKIYEINFGLKSLILLQENSNIMMDNDKHFLLYCGLISKQPDITFEEVDDIIRECDLSLLDIKPNLLSYFEIEELYIKAIGEMGIALQDFYRMTPKEIDLAYEGYLRRKELEANLTKLAIASQGTDELIRLTEDRQYEIGNKAERQAIFDLLLGGNENGLFNGIE